MPGKKSAGKELLKAKRAFASDKRSVSILLNGVRGAIRRYGMFERGSRVMVAVSGGVDSVVLLKALCLLKRDLGISLVVANLDHGIRGKESRRDSAFVRDLSARMGLPFVHRRLRLGRGASGGRSVEERARDARYGFLMEAAEDAACAVICTGHTMDDQAETVLMRVIKGASFAALAGIPPVRAEKNVRIVRPLIGVTKKEVIAFAKALGLPCVQDSTNECEDLFRNSVRLKIIPYLEKFNPGVRRALVNLSDDIRDELAARPAPSGVRGGVGNAGAGRILVELTDILLQPKAVRKAVFRESLRRSGGDLKALSYRHWIDMDKLLKSGVDGASLDLPGHVRVRREGAAIVFSRTSPAGGPGSAK